MIKKILTLILTLGLLLTMAGCGGSEEAEETLPYVIGIDMYGDNPALSSCRSGFMDTLEAEGFVKDENLKIISKNGECNKKTATQNTASILAQGATLICAFSTPMAQIAADAVKDSDVSVVYAGVSDTNATGLTKGNITGTCAAAAPEKQLEMIRTILPEAQTIGIMYCAEEENSATTLKAYEEAAAGYGFTIVSSAIHEVNDMPLAADKLLLEVDCMTTISDNTVASSLSTILHKAKDLNIPVFGNDVEQVKDGCVAAYGVDYYKVGVETANLTIKILKGEAQAKDLPPVTLDQAKIYYNPDKLDELQITLPEALTETAIDMNDTNQEE